MKSQINTSIIENCKDKLIQTKAQLLNRLRTNQSEYIHRDKVGDEIDASTNMLAENQFLSNQQRILTQLKEIESALARIERNQFGVCEVTEEPIEEARLLALPWTRLSIEGAEIQEAKQKIYVK